MVATTSLLYSIEVAERAFDQAGQYPLNDNEREDLRRAGLDNDAADLFFQGNIMEAPKSVELNE